MLYYLLIHFNVWFLDDLYLYINHMEANLNKSSHQNRGIEMNWSLPLYEMLQQ
jgi:hypothetical protein